MGSLVAVITNAGVITGAKLVDYSAELFALDTGAIEPVAYWQNAKLALEGLPARPGCTCEHYPDGDDDTVLSVRNRSCPVHGDQAPAGGEAR